MKIQKPGMASGDTRTLCYYQYLILYPGYGTYPQKIRARECSRWVKLPAASAFPTADKIIFVKVPAKFMNARMNKNIRASLSGPSFASRAL